jgi:AraC-like DNA-binding protein
VAELAYAGGYADQAHLCHECSALAGTTPSALLAG